MKEKILKTFEWRPEPFVGVIIVAVAYIIIAKIGEIVPWLYLPLILLWTLFSLVVLVLLAKRMMG